MSGLSNHYGLTIQGKREKYDVEILNRNFRKIDEAINGLEESKPNPEDVISSHQWSTFVHGEMQEEPLDYIPDVENPTLVDLLDRFILEGSIRWISFVVDAEEIAGCPIDTGKGRVTIHGTSPLEWTDDVDNGETEYLITFERMARPFDIYTTDYNVEDGLNGKWVKVFSTSDIQTTTADDNDKPVSSSVTHGLHERITVIEDKAPVMKTGLVTKIAALDTVDGKVILPRIVGNMSVGGDPNMKEPPTVYMASNPLSLRNYGNNFFPYMEERYVGGIRMYQDAAGIYFEGTASSSIQFELNEMNILMEGKDYYLKANDLTGINAVMLYLVDTSDDYIPFLTITSETLESHATAEQVDNIKELSFQIIIDEGAVINRCVKIACTCGKPSDDDLYPTVKIYELQTPKPMVSIPITNYNTKPDLKILGKRFISNSIKTNFSKSYFHQRVGYDNLDRDSWTVYKETDTWTDKFALFQNRLSQEGDVDDAHIICYSSMFKAIPMVDMVNPSSLDEFDTDCISILGDTVVIAVKKERFEENPVTPSTLDTIMIKEVDIFYQLKTEVKTDLATLVDVESFNGATYLLINDNPCVLMDVAYGENQSGQDVLTSIASLLGN